MSIEVMKRALAALETCRIRSVSEWSVEDITPKNVTAAIAALRTALPQQPAMSEPVGQVSDLFPSVRNKLHAKGFDSGAPLYTQPAPSVPATTEPAELSEAKDTKSKAWAWDGVCDALNEHWPQWSSRPTNGAACATLAIADMAKAARTHPAPSVPGDVALDCYDAGILNDFGGGNVEWWQDYIRAELGNAHDFYQSQIDAAMLAAK